jgi:hypothetical protein
VEFETRFGDDRYPMGRLVLRRAADLGLSRSEVVRRLGYLNADKGHRRLGRLLTTGAVPPQIGSVLAAAFEVEPGTVQAAIAETAAQHHAEKEARLDAEDAAYRAAFRPHLRAEVEHAVPMPIFVAIVRGPGLRLVAMPEGAWTTDDVERRRHIKRAIISHYSAWRGRLSAYGKIVGYTAVIETTGRFDVGMPFGVDGAPIESSVLVERIGTGALMVKGHAIPPRWFHARQDDQMRCAGCGPL